MFTKNLKKFTKKLEKVHQKLEKIVQRWVTHLKNALDKALNHNGHLRGVQKVET